MPFTTTTVKASAPVVTRYTRATSVASKLPVRKADINTIWSDDNAPIRRATSSCRRSTLLSAPSSDVRGQTKVKLMSRNEKENQPPSRSIAGKHQLESTVPKRPVTFGKKHISTPTTQPAPTPTAKTEFKTAVSRRQPRPTSSTNATRKPQQWTCSKATTTAGKVSPAVGITSKLPNNAVQHGLPSPTSSTGSRTPVWIRSTRVRTPTPEPKTLEVPSLVLPSPPITPSATRTSTPTGGLQEEDDVFVSPIRSNVNDIVPGAAKSLVASRVEHLDKGFEKFLKHEKIADVPTIKLRNPFRRSAPTMTEVTPVLLQCLPLSAVPGARLDKILESKVPGATRPQTPSKEVVHTIFGPMVRPMSNVKLASNQEATQIPTDRRRRALAELSKLQSSQLVTGRFTAAHFNSKAPTTVPQTDLAKDLATLSQRTRSVATLADKLQKEFNFDPTPKALRATA